MTQPCLPVWPPGHCPQVYAPKLRKVIDILSGKTPISLFLDFLYR